MLTPEQLERLDVVGKFSNASYPQSSIRFNEHTIEFCEKNKTMKELYNKINSYLAPPDEEGKIKNVGHFLNGRKLNRYFNSPKNESLGTDSEVYAPAQQNFSAPYKQVGKFLHGKKMNVIDSIWKQASKMVDRILSPIMSDSRIKSLEEVCVEMDLSKSCGPLENINFKSKRDYIESVIGQKIYSDYWTELAGIGGSKTIWGGCNKDEIRDIERVLQNKTRLMFPASVNHTLAGAQLLQDQNQRLREHRSKIPIKIGLSRYGPEMDECIRSLGDLKHVATADGNGWDSLFYEEAMWTLCELRWSWLQDKDKTFENKMRLCNWYANKINKFIVLPDRTIVNILGGEGSGTYTTIDDNSIYHLLQFCYIWIMLKNNEDEEEFLEKWKILITGDDALFNLDVPFDEFLELYDKFLPHEHHGKFEDLSNVSFCAQKFTEVNGKYVCVPNKERCLNALFWKTKNNQLHELVMKVCAIRLHGYFIPEVRSICDEYYTFLMDKFRPIMTAQELKICRNSYLTDHQTEKIYFGYESDSAVSISNRIKRWIDEFPELGEINQR